MPCLRLVLLAGRVRNTRLGIFALVAVSLTMGYYQVSLLHFDFAAVFVDPGFL